MIKQIQILFAFLLCSPLILGQIPFKIKNYSCNEGLSNSSVYNITKDEDGFLWISTELGINKFDGKNFHKYTPNSHDLPDNTVTHSTIINDHEIFFSTGTSGYFIFDTKTEKVKRSNLTNPSFLHKSHNLKIHKDKVYLIGVQNIYILVFDLKKNQITDTLSTNKVPIFDFDFDEDDLIIATGKGLMHYIDNKFVPYHLKGWPKFQKQKISTLSVKKENTYFSNGTTLYVYDKIKQKITDSVRYSKTEKHLGKLFIDKSGNAWFNTYVLSELYHYNFRNKKLINFEPFVSGNDNSITSIIQDDEGNVWIGTYNNGLYKISPSAFKTLSGLSNNNIFKVSILDSDTYMLGLKNGFTILDNKSLTTESIKFNPNDIDYIYDFKKRGNLVIVANRIHNNISLKKGKTTFLFVRARSICLVSDTTLVVGSWNNKLYLNKLKNGKIDSAGIFSFEKQIDKKSRSNCFLLDKSGRVWLGTDHGLLYFSASDYNNIHKVDEPLLNLQITDIIESKSGKLYIATNSGLFNYFNNKLSVVNELNNRPIEKINSFCKDSSDNIYVGTLNGLFVIKPNGTSEYYDIEDGLSSNEINHLIFNVQNNSIVTGTKQGICLLNLNLKTHVGNHIPRLYFDTITSIGNITFSNGIYELEKRNVNIRFSSVCFTRPNSIVYKWVLDNGADRFLENPVIEMAALSYGRHSIKMMASNDGKNWSKPILIELLIPPPFYFTTWFLVLSGFVFCLCVWLYIRYRIRKIRETENKKSEVEQKIVSLKYEALNASINPHFIFNALNSVQHYINTNRNDEASDYLAKFGHLIRQTIETATEHFIDLEREKQRLQLYVELEQLRFNKKFTFEFIIDNSINKKETKIPNMILQPLIENSILHGFKQIGYEGKLSLRILKESDLLKIIIEDNGRGIRETESNSIASGKTKSIGLQNVEERLSTIPGATFTMRNKADNNIKEHGVIIEITLPLNYEPT